jgi:hypothetical protein
MSSANAVFASRTRPERAASIMRPSGSSTTSIPGSTGPVGCSSVRAQNTCTYSSLDPTVG